jgi:hypothetical protein
MGEQTSGTFLLFTVGGCFCAAGGQPLVHILSGDKSLKARWPATSAVTVGAFLILLSIFWRPSTGGSAALMQTLNRWGSNPAPYAIILLLFWGYLQTLAIRRNIELETLSNDQHSMVEVLNRAVLPRQLNQGQINSIVHFLQNFPPQEVTIESIPGDDEAASYAGDLSRALTRSGWNVKWKWSPDIPNGGLGVHYSQTMATSQIPFDFKNPKVDLILKMALGFAGVPVDHSGSGSAIANTENSLMLMVGRRRKIQAERTI